MQKEVPNSHKLQGDIFEKDFQKKRLEKLESTWFLIVRGWES